MPEPAEIPTQNKEREGNHILEKIVFTETGPYKITTSRETLVQNFLAAAHKQGMNSELAANLAHNITFSLDSNVDFVARRFESLHFPESALGVLNKLFSRLDTSLAVVEKGKGGKIEAVNIDVQAIADRIKKGGVRNFKVPSDMPKEYTQQAITQLIDALWNHERQHLIQGVRPKTKSEKIERALLITSGIGTAMGFATSLGIEVVCQTLPIDPLLKISLARTANDIAAVSASVTPFLSLYHQRFASYEKEANKFMKDPLNTHMPFTVVAEA